MALLVKAERKTKAVIFCVVVVDLDKCKAISPAADRVTAEGLALGYNGAAIKDGSRLRAVVMRESDA